MVPKEETTTVLLKLPMDIKDWVEKEAARTLVLFIGTHLF